MMLTWISGGNLPGDLEFQFGKSGDKGKTLIWLAVACFVAECLWLCSYTGCMWLGCLRRLGTALGAESPDDDRLHPP